MGKIQRQVYCAHCAKQSEEAAKRIAQTFEMKEQRAFVFHGIKFNLTSIYTIIKKHRPEWRKLLTHQGKKQKYSASVGKIPNRVSIKTVQKS